MKALLKSQLGKIFEFGSYSLSIQKVADTKVTFHEIINGQQFQHTYFTIYSAYKYFEYKTKHLLPALAKKRNDIDLTKASAEYRNQHHSYTEFCFELEVFLQQYIKTSIENPYTLHFESERFIIVEYALGQTIEIAIRPNNIMQFIKIDCKNSNIYEICNLVPHITFGKLLDATCVEYTNDKIGKFAEMLHKYYDLRMQLNKFKITINENSEFPVKTEDIIGFVNTAEDNDCFAIDLQPVANRKRTLNIIRQSRVKYLIEVRNFTEDDIMQEEFWSYINKFSSDFTSNIEYIKKLYNALD